MTSQVETSEKKIFIFLQSFFDEPLTLYTLVVALSICAFIILDGLYGPFVSWISSHGLYWLEENYPLFATVDDREFSKGFVEWFGVFYGFLLPLLLVRAWEQLDSADRQFDREADAIKVLLEDISLLEDEPFLPFKLEVVRRLYLYTWHVKKKYKIEHLKQYAYLRSRGNYLLQGIRVSYKNLIYRGGLGASQLEPMTTELLERLNDAIDVRGDRLAIFNQRLYEIFRMVSIITSIIWLVPFYFLDFELGIFGGLLKLAVTFLITLVLTIIDDLDDPFTGYWRINTDSWEEVYEETRSSLIGIRQLIFSQSIEKQGHIRVTKEEKTDFPVLGRDKLYSQPMFNMLTWLLAFKYLFLDSEKHDSLK